MLRRKVLSLATALVFLTTSGLAVAQDATTPPPAAPPAAEPTPEATPPAPAEPAPAEPAPQAEVVVGDQAETATPTSPEERTEEILVTGSRIRRKDLTTPAPVSVITRESFTSSGKVNVGEFLQALPEQGNALNTQENNANEGNVNVSLRSLDAKRTLVLVNGRRLVAGGVGANDSPDLLSIPAAAVERIEVLKDGASAVYGSDAVAGVVNIILKKRFEGTEVSAYGGVSGEGDGEVYDLSVLTGTSSDRGNILFSLGYQEQNDILNRDRSWAETPLDFDWTTRELIPTGNSSTNPGGRFSIPSPSTNCPSADPDLAPLCTLWEDSATDPDDRTNSFVQNADGTYRLYEGELFNTYPTNFLVTPSRRIQLFATGDTNIGDVARGFFEASYVNRRSSQTLAPMPLTNSSIPDKPIFVSADSIYNPFGVELTSWRRRTMEFGDRVWSHDIDTFRIVAGVDGTLGGWAGPLSDWSWELAYTYGRTTGTEVSENQLRMPNVQNAVGPSMLDPDSGAPICVRVPGDPTSVIPGCVPWDVLSAADAPIDPAYAQRVKDYVSFTGTDRGTNRQDVYSANVSGELFPLPTSDRPIGLAFGVDHRRESGTYRPDPITASLESSGNNYLPTDGEYDVTEGYAELSVPILSGIPWAHNLEATAAARIFDYSTFGTDNTYKFGARWSPFRDVTLRGTFSTAFRAPNIAELFSGTTDSYEFRLAGDPCSGAEGELADFCASPAGGSVPGGDSQDGSVQFLTKWISNPDLEPETADTFTAGVVIEPRWVRNLSVTLDYYNIQVDNAIDLRGANFILDRCYVDRDLDMCALIVRSPINGQIAQINDTRVNVYKYDTAGFDVAVRYGLPTPNFGRFNFIVDATILEHFTQTDEAGNDTDGEGRYDLGVLPRLKFNAGVLWGMGPFGLGVATRYVGGYEECSSTICSSDDSESRRVESYMPFDVYASYRLRTAGTTTINVGVLNVADEDPPYLWNAAAANSDPTAYDYLGRYVYARLTHNF